jgi:hypothetical protein
MNEALIIQTRANILTAGLCEAKSEDKAFWNDIRRQYIRQLKLLIKQS